MSDSQKFEAECFWEKEQFGVKKRIFLYRNHPASEICTNIKNALCHSKTYIAEAGDAI